MTQEHELSPELVEELVSFVRDMNKVPLRHDLALRVVDLVCKLPAPPDPDIEEARRITAETPAREGEDDPEGVQDWCAEVINGLHDNCYEVRAVLAAIKRGRALERGEA